MQWPRSFAHFIPLALQAAIHPRLLRMAIIAECKEVGKVICPSVHQGTAMIDFKLDSAAAEDAFMAVSPLYVVFH